MEEGQKVDGQAGGKSALRRVKGKLIEEFGKGQIEHWRRALKSSHLQKLALAHALSTRYRALQHIDESKLSKKGRKGLLSKGKLLKTMFYLDSLDTEELVTVWGWEPSQHWGVELLWAM